MEHLVLLKIKLQIFLNKTISWSNFQLKEELNQHHKNKIQRGSSQILYFEIIVVSCRIRDVDYIGTVCYRELRNLQKTVKEFARGHLWIHSGLKHDNTSDAFQYIWANHRMVFICHAYNNNYHYNTCRGKLLRSESFVISSCRKRKADALVNLARVKQGEENDWN